MNNLVIYIYKYYFTYFNLYISSLKFVPPVDTIHSTFKYFPISITKFDTYNANSLVGTKIKLYNFPSTSSISSIGMIYAPVLPVPFLALAIIFDPANAKGIVSSYIGDGFS